MPNEPRSGPVTSDGYRDYGFDRRQRVNFDLERLDKRQKQPGDR